MDRFLLAENPRTDNGIAIIHTIDPIAIIEVIEGHIVSDTFKGGHYTYGIEDYTLLVRHYFTTNMNLADDAEARKAIDKLLDRAWHWYESYMVWEDDRS